MYRSKFETGAVCATPLALVNRDEQTNAQTDGLLMAPAKIVVVSRFEVPAKFVRASGPEHEIEHGFAADRVSRGAGFPGMNPLRTNAGHELDL